MFGSLDENAGPDNKVKFGVDLNESRRKRQEAAVQIRKNKRDENLRKRRTTGGADVVRESAPSSEVTETEIGANIANLALMLAAVKSSDVNEQLKGTRALRKLLASQHSTPPVQEVIDAGFLPYICDFLRQHNFPKLQFEAAWALTNIGSSDLTSSIVDAGSLPLLIPLLNSEDPTVREQAAWCMGNIAGDSCQYRDMVLDAPGALEGLLNNLAHPANTMMLRNVTWSVSNLCRGRDPKPSLVKLRPMIPLLAKIVKECQDSETIVDATWALSYISDGENERLEAIVETDICPTLVRLLSKREDLCIPPCLRTLGNIVTSTEQHTQAAIDAGLLNELVPLLTFKKQNVRKEAAWTASNITAGTIAQITAFLKTPGLTEAIMYCLSHDEWNVQKEAAWTIGNICTGGTFEQVEHIVDNHGAMKGLCDLLTNAVADNKITVVILTALSSILQMNPEKYTSQLEEMDQAFEHILELQSHKDSSVYERASEVLKFFPDDDDEEDAMVPDVTANGNTFAFTTPPAPGGDTNPQNTFNFGNSSAPSGGFNFN